MSASRTSAQADAALQTAAGLLRSARHAVVFSGAGISTPSGVPDFRSKGTGLWEQYDPMEVASLAVFQSRPDKFYDWLRPLLQTIWKAQPNPAHIALAQMEAAGFIKAVVTQNIDDLHQRAGSKNIYELHGSLLTISCPRCRKIFPSEQFRAQVEGAGRQGNSIQEPQSRGNGLPRCPHCQRVLKPDIVLFGEMLPTETWRAAEDHCKRADVMLVVGSSLEVWPAASLPELAQEYGAHLIIINYTPTHLDGSADALLPYNVAEVLPKIATLVL
jgi:NAD-dependent deacetylase